MTKKKLAAVVTTVSLLLTVTALSQNVGTGFFSNDYGFSLFSYQGSIGLFIATGNGCPPNGFYAETGLIDSLAGLASFDCFRRSEGGVSFLIPGVVWLLGLGLVCALLFRSASRGVPTQEIKPAEQA